MCRNLRTVVLMGLVFFLSGIVTGKCPEGDFTADCRIDLSDLAELSRWWLSDNCQAPDCTADVNGDLANPVRHSICMVLVPRKIFCKLPIL